MLIGIGTHYCYGSTSLVFSEGKQFSGSNVSVYRNSYGARVHCGDRTHHSSMFGRRHKSCPFNVISKHGQWVTEGYFFSNDNNFSSQFKPEPYTIEPAPKPKSILKKILGLFK